MIKLLKLATIAALLLISAAAQTTYTIPAGTTCTSVEGCYYHDLTATASDGSTLYGLFAAGGYWTQFDYQAFQGQDSGYKAQYCNGTAVWTVAATPDLGPTAYFYTMDCQASPDQTSSDPPVTLHAEIEAHSYVATFVCGGRVRTVCHQTQWLIDSGFLRIQ